MQRTFVPRGRVGGGGGGVVGYFGFQVTGMIEGYFGFEIFDSGIFWARKIGQVFFWAPVAGFK